MSKHHISVAPSAVLLVIVGFAVSAGLGHGELRDGPAESDQDVHHLVLLAPEQPVFIEIRIRVDGRGLTSVRAAYAAQLMKNYDKDGDGLLDLAEAKNVPPLIKSPTNRESVSIADRWEAVDCNPVDDKVSAEELGAYIDRVVGSPFELSLRPQRTTQSVDLFTLFDRNQDGRLTQPELAAAPRTIRKLDLDEDETLTIDELQPFTNPQVSQIPIARPNASVDQPLLSLDDKTALRGMAEQLLQRYGTANPAMGKLVARRDCLGMAESVFAAADADANGELDATELAAYLKRPAPSLIVEARFVQKEQGRPKLVVVADPLHAVAVEKIAARPLDKLTFSSGGIGLQLQLVANRSNLSDSRGLIKTSRFATADADKNNYLSQQEFAALGMPEADFKSVDRNGDGMVVMDEILAYIDQESVASQSRIEMAISHDGKSIFELLDKDNDHRISRRELAMAFEGLKGNDLNGDGVITAVELTGRFKAVIQLGRPVLFRNLAARSGGNVTTPIANRPSAGPDWFRRMDRNRDGDVSQREFLGPLAAFKKLDTDGDGLISAAEAEKAGIGDKAMGNAP